MIGDKYQVYYSLDNHTVLYGETNSWREAKALRGNAFNQNRKARAVWVIRTNPSLNLKPDHRGFTLRRTKYETA